MKDFKRFLSIVLAVAVVGSVFAITALAADYADSNEPPSEAASDRVPPYEETTDSHNYPGADKTVGIFTIKLKGNGEASLVSINDDSSAEISVPGEIGGYKITTFEDNALANAAALKKLVLPDTLTDFTGSCFGKKSDVSEIVVSAGNNYIREEDGIIYDRKKITVLAAVQSLSGNIKLPETVRTIGKMAFYNCSRITGIELPDSVETFKDAPFHGCESLRTVNVPRQVTEIGRAFMYSGVRVVNINANVNDITKSSFWGCTELEQINVAADNPNYCSEGGVLYNKEKTSMIFCPPCKSGELVMPDGAALEDYAFSGCKNLTSIKLSPAATRIPTFAFQQCTSLKTLYIPSNVTEISDRFFATLPALDTVYFAGTRNQWNSALSGEDTYVLNGVTVIMYKTSQGGMQIDYIEPSTNKMVKIPSTIDGEKVTSISGSAFADCSEVSEIRIPSSVTSLGNGAFTGASVLQSVKYAGNREQWDEISAESGLAQSASVRTDFIAGDVNLDKFVDSSDATLVLQMYAEIIGGENSDLADVNGDGITDSGDATLILQLYAGIIDEL